MNAAETPTPAHYLQVGVLSGEVIHDFDCEIIGPYAHAQGGFDTLVRVTGDHFWAGKKMAVMSKCLTLTPSA